MREAQERPQKEWVILQRSKCLTQTTKREGAILVVDTNRNEGKDERQAQQLVRRRSRRGHLP